MKEYQRKRENDSKRSTLVAVASTLAVHVLALTLVSFKGLSYLYPPPPEQTFLIDFSADIQETIEPRYDKEPVAETVDLEKPVELVQKSESPVVEKDIPNETPAQEDNFGDVEVPAPEVEEKPKVDPRASFPGMGRKESSATTPHTATDTSAVFKAGQSNGNSLKDVTEGQANAHLKGRNVVGNLVKPRYDRQSSGVVVVTIWVDIYGDVKNAQAGAPGTTVDDPQLWNAARTAAMNTHFERAKHIAEDTPPLQEGTITYYFKLK